MVPREVVREHVSHTKARVVVVVAVCCCLEEAGGLLAQNLTRGDDVGEGTPGGDIDDGETGGVAGQDAGALSLSHGVRLRW